MTTGTQGTPGGNKPNANEVVQGLLAKLGIPTQPNPPTAPNATTPTAAPTETRGHPSDVVLSQPATAGETETHSGNESLSQLPAEVEVALAAVRGGVSVEVNVSGCSGVCGGRVRGLRLSPVEYLALVHLRDALGYRSFCDVLRDPRFGGLFCSGGRRGRVVSGVEQVLKVVRLLKEVSRVGSREGPYAAGYLVKRLLDGVPYYEFVGYLKRKLMASVAGDLLLRALNGGSVPSVNLDFLAQVADGLLAYFTRELGFDNTFDFARYLQAAVKVVESRFTARHGGYRDVDGLVCSDGVVFSTTEPALRVFWRLVWHLKHDHGLVNLGDIEGKAEVGRDRVNFILTNMRGLESLVSWLSDGIAARGLVKDGVCTLCGGGVGDDPFEVVLHFVNWHREQAEDLFKNLGQRQVREPQVLDLLEDAAREVAQRTGVDYEIALGVVKTVHSVINIEGALSVDEIMLHMNFYDPALATRLTGIDVRHLVLAVKEALEARGLIDVRVKEKAQPEAKAEAKPEEPHSSEPKAKDVEQPEEPKPEAGAKANTVQPEAKPNEAHPSGCRPEDVGAKPEDRDTILFQLACTLYREFGKPGNYMALASELLSELRKGKCSEKALLKLGYGNVKAIIRALKRLKMC